jgi:putative transposase
MRLMWLAERPHDLKLTVPAAGMLNAERSFRRIKGYTQMPQLVTALRRHARPETAEDTDLVGAAA